MSSPQANAGAGAPAPATLPQRIEDMQGTLAKMHAVLKQMHANSAKSQPKDPVAKANLEMWELLVGHLEKQLHELQAAQAVRQDMEARRAALYKQADAKADAEAQAARAAQAAKAANGGEAPAPSVPAAGKSPAQNAPAQPSPAPAANDSSSPH